MDPVAMAPLSTAGGEWRSLLDRIRVSLRQNTRQIVISAIVAAVFGFIANVYLIYFSYDGYHKTVGTPATGESNLLSGGLFWILAMAVCSALANYWYSIGTARFFKEVCGLPSVLKTLLSQDGYAARAHIWWGAAAGLLAAQLISPWLCGIVAVAMFSSSSSILLRLVSTSLYGLWNKLTGVVSPAPNTQLSGILAVSVGLLGSCAALAVSFFLVSGIGKGNHRLAVPLVEWPDLRHFVRTFHAPAPLGVGHRLGLRIGNLRDSFPVRPGVSVAKQPDGPRRRILGLRGLWDVFNVGHLHHVACSGTPQLHWRLDDELLNLLADNWLAAA